MTIVMALGFPEHIPFDAFCRRYSTLLPPDSVDSSVGKKDIVEMVLYSQGLDRSSYRVGLSQAFLRAGTLTSMDRLVEDNIHKTMVLFQVRIAHFSSFFSPPLTSSSYPSPSCPSFHFPLSLFLLVSPPILTHPLLSCLTSPLSPSH